MTVGSGGGGACTHTRNCPGVPPQAKFCATTRYGEGTGVTAGKEEAVAVGVGAGGVGKTGGAGEVGIGVGRMPPEGASGVSRYTCIAGV